MERELQNHICFKVTQEVAQICKPLFEYFGITYFDMLRTYEDGSRTRLTTHPEWVEHYFKKEYYKCAKLEKHPSLYTSGFRIWDYWKKDNDPFWDMYGDMLINFNRGHGISIIQKRNGHLDNFVFTTTRNNENINSLYMSNIEALEKFIFYFKNKASRLILAAENNKLPCPIEKESFYCEDGSGLQQSQQLSKFHDATKVECLEINWRNKNIALSKRETECVYKLLERKTAKEIARDLKLSPRTVEFFIDNIKAKFDCSTTKELIQIILAY